MLNQDFPLWNVLVALPRPPLPAFSCRLGPVGCHFRLLFALRLSLFLFSVFLSLFSLLSNFLFVSSSSVLSWPFFSLRKFLPLLSRNLTRPPRILFFNARAIRSFFPIFLSLNEANVIEPIKYRWIWSFFYDVTCSKRTMSGTLVRGGDWERFWFVCACLSKQHTKFLQGKEVNFFSKDEKKRLGVAFLCASLSLSLSLCFLSYKRSSLRWREEESSREIIRVLLFFFACSSSRPFPTLLGKFYSRRHHGGGVCVWSFCSLPRVFSFCCCFLFGQSSVCALFCCSFYCHGRTIYLHNAFPLYPMRGKHIKVFIIIHNI